MINFRIHVPLTFKTQSEKRTYMSNTKYTSKAPLQLDTSVASAELGRSKTERLRTNKHMNLDTSMICNCVTK